MLQNDLQKATQNARSTASFRKVLGNIGSANNSKFNKSNGVLIKARYRKHRGGGSKPNAGGKMQSHIKYLAGDKHKEEQKEKRELFNDHGEKIKSEKATERHKDAFIEHRIVISPAGNNTTKHDLHILSQSMISEIRERHPKAEIEASYAIHQDTKHPHSHVLITSQNVVKLTREFYDDARVEMKELKQILDDQKEKDRGLDWSQDIFKDKKQDQDLGVSL